MAGVKHTFSVAIADDASAIAAGMVLPSHWNAEHTLSGVAEQSALDVVSAAVEAVSAANASLAGSVAGAISAIAANSAQMTSADNAISAAVAALSAQHTSLAGSVAGALSAIAANSAQMTSADNAISAAVAALSAQHTSLAGSVAGALSAIAANSATMIAKDISIMSAVSVESAARAAADISIMSAVSVESAARAAADTSLDGRATSVMSAVSVESAARAAADISIMSAVSVESANRVSADNALSATIAGVLTSGQGPVRKTLAGNQTHGPSALLSISGFTFTVSAGVGYEFNFFILASSPISLAAPQFLISAPTNNRFYADLRCNAIAEATKLTNVNSAGIRMSGMTTVSATGVARATYIRGGFIASTAGTLALKMGNAISGGAAGSSIVVLAGSWGYCWRVA